MDGKVTVEEDALKASRPAGGLKCRSRVPAPFWRSMVKSITRVPDRPACDDNNSINNGSEESDDLGITRAVATFLLLPRCAYEVLERLNRDDGFANVQHCLHLACEESMRKYLASQLRPLANRVSPSVDHEERFKTIKCDYLLLGCM